MGPDAGPWFAHAARGLAGGALIGAAAALLMLALGRIAGVSGIALGLVRPARGDTAWRLAFVLGLAAAPGLLHALGLALAPTLAPSAGWLALSGLLVGLGTRIGGGCTSGHGVCGIARLSRRSFVATASFVAAGMLAATLFDLLARRFAS